jgi:lipid-binding SYLF domain-containing protein
MRLFTSCTLTLAAVSLIGCATPQGKTAADKRQFIDDQADNTVAMVMKDKDLAQADLDEAAGYAAITNIGTSVLLIGADDGYGVLVNNETGERTYLDVSGVDFGPGVGIAKYRTLMIFEDPEPLQRFKEGHWEFGAGVAATAKTEDAGGSAENAATFNNDVDVYITGEEGLAVSAAIRGMVIKVNPELN